MAGCTSVIGGIRTDAVASGIFFSHHLRICFKIASGKIPRYKAWPDVVREMESGRDWKLESDLRDGVIPT